MAVTQLRRRAVLQGAGALGAAALGLPSPARAEDLRMRIYWWGSQDRARRTEAVIDLYQKQHPGVTLVGEVGSADYWTKLDTQIAGRSAPDIFSLEPNTIADYARRGACLALDKLIPKPLDIASFGQPMIDLAAADGHVWGVGCGLNSFSMFYIKDVFAASRLPEPTWQTTWKDYADLAVELTKAIGKPGMAGSCDGSRYQYAFETWLRQRGSALFTADQKIAFTPDQATEWFAYWADIRKRGGCVPADVQAMDNIDIQTNALTLGKCAMTLAYSNQMVGYQLAVKPTLGITMNPSGGPGAKPGQYYRAALIWSIAKTAKHPEAAADFLNFFANDPAAGKILGVERGVPLSPAIRQLVLPDLDPTERATVDYVNFIADKVGPQPVPRPKGSGQFDIQVMRPTADLVAFGKLSPKEAAKKLVDDGNEVLG
jgi:multiple sugar transport system substrate-binding protein